MPNISDPNAAAKGRDLKAISTMAMFPGDTIVDTVSRQWFMGEMARLNISLGLNQKITQYLDTT